MKKNKILNTILISALLLAILAFTAQVVYIVALSSTYFWDFRSYYTSAINFFMGQNPYSTPLSDESLFSYTYPLLSLYFFYPFTLLSVENASLVNLSLQLIVAGLLFSLWFKKFIFPGESILFAIFFLIALNSPLSISLRSGNIALFETGLIWLGVYFYLKEQQISFTVCILGASIFKLVPVGFLLLLIVSDYPHKWRLFFVSIGAFLAIQILSISLFVEYFQNFLENIQALYGDRRGAINPNLSLFYKNLSSLLEIPNAYFISVIIIALISALKLMKMQGSLNKVIFFTLSYCLLLPRLKDYSYSVLILPIFLTIQSIRPPSMKVTLLLLALLPSYYITHFLVSNHMVEKTMTLPILFWDFSPLVVLVLCWVAWVGNLIPGIEGREGEIPDGADQYPA